MLHTPIYSNSNYLTDRTIVQIAVIDGTNNPNSIRNMTFPLTSARCPINAAANQNVQVNKNTIK